jgi:REP element-mobilizing transposase RayT
MKGSNKMPRTARVKSYDSIYHIMVRSISDTPLFKDDTDKIKYLGYLKKYQDMYKFKLYSYCIMTTHAHMIMDPTGADISKIMHAVNQSYAQYFNKKYDRHGHLFQDRFKSKVVHNEKYLITLSGYIHNNPKDIERYCDKVEDYEFSSLGIYLGLRKDYLGLVEPDFIMQQFGKYVKQARKAYLKFVSTCNEEKLKEEMELQNEKTEYRSERHIILRNFTPESVVDFVANYTNHVFGELNIKYNKSSRELRALFVLIMRGLCDMGQREICKFLGNITQSYVSRLCAEGYRLMSERREYRDIVKCFMKQHAQGEN